MDTLECFYLVNNNNKKKSILNEAIEINDNKRKGNWIGHLMRGIFTTVLEYTTEWRWGEEGRDWTYLNGWLTELKNKLSWIGDYM